jgi:hypothetical protein
MEVLDNISKLLGDDLKGTVRPGAKVRIAASSFSIYAFEALKQELESVEDLQFIFTTPTFECDDHQRAGFQRSRQGCPPDL